MSARETSDFKTFVNICAYGRAASARSCARRSFAAETICMALVICRVFFTLRMRRRMSKIFAKFYFFFPALVDFAFGAPPDAASVSFNMMSWRAISIVASARSPRLCPSLAATASYLQSVRRSLEYSYTFSFWEPYAFAPAAALAACSRTVA